MRNSSATCLTLVATSGFTLGFAAKAASCVTVVLRFSGTAKSSPAIRLIIGAFFGTPKSNKSFCVIVTGAFGTAACAAASFGGSGSPNISAGALAKVLAAPFAEVIGGVASA